MNLINFIIFIIEFILAFDSREKKNLETID